MARHSGVVKKARRRRSLVLLAAATAVAFALVLVSAFLSRPESVKLLQAVATIDSSGNASVTESIDYFFPHSRHGIYRTLPDVPFSAAPRIHVGAPSGTPADLQVSPMGSGVKLQIGDPHTTIRGTHNYRITYPLDTLHLSGNSYGWNGVGTSWDVPVQHTELDVVAPWTWVQPRCDAGRAGSFGGCQVTQPQPGHLVVSYDHQLPSRSGLTVYGQRGADLPAAPAARTFVSPSSTNLMITRGLPIAALAAVAGLIAALVAARALRRAGRDWVATGSAADAAFASRQAVDGALRVDDTELDQLTTIEFAPPRELAAWQGGVLEAEAVLKDHRTAWLLTAVEQGYLDMDDSDPSAVVLTLKPHASDNTTVLLATAFAGRPSITLGKYDAPFSAMWSSLDNVMKHWFDASGLRNVAASHRAARTRVFGALAVVAGVIVLWSTGHAVNHPGLLDYPRGLLGGILALGGLALVLRAWELEVRTPAGSALWLRVESFRRFISGSEAHHVAEAAERGVLREYTAWAVALDEVDHWSKMAEAAQLPSSTSGLAFATHTSTIASSIASTGTAPHSSGGGGGGGGSGGGGGGGGGGSW